MQIFRLTTIDSTNNWAKSHLSQFPHQELSVVVANEQTAGRGSFSKQWLSPPDLNIYASFVFFMKEEAVEPAFLVQLLAKSSVRFLQTLGFSPSIKWPNDLLIHSKKVAGILCETVPCNEVTAIIMGIGLNVNMTPSMLAMIDQPATSLLAESNHHWDLNLVLEGISKEFATATLSLYS